MLKRCTLLNGDVVHRADPPAVHRLGAYFVPNTWGLFDRSGALLRDSGYFRGPEPTLVNAPPVLPDFAPDRAKLAPDGEYLFLGPVHAHYGHFLLATFSRLWTVLRDRSVHYRLLTYALPDLAANPFVETLLNAVGYSTRDCVTFHDPTLVPNVTVPGPAFEETNFVHPEFGELCRAAAAVLVAGTPSRPSDRPFYAAKFALGRGVARLEREEVIAEALSRRGVDVVFPEKMSLPDQIRLFQDRPGGIGLIGSAFHTAAFVTGKRFVLLAYGNRILSNQPLIDRGCGHETLYLHPASGVSSVETPAFRTLYRLERPEAVAEDLLRICDVAFGGAASAAVSRGGGAAEDVILPSRLGGLENVALGKATSQSSNSPQSFGRSADEDSRGAVSGFCTGSFQFHTAFEEAPWWQVDLGTRTDVAEIRLYNRLDECPERASRFLIAASDDGAEWFTVLDADLEQPFGGADGRPFCWRPRDRLETRFVRISASIPTHLHLDQVAVFGTPVAAAGRGTVPVSGPAEDHRIVGFVDHFVPPDLLTGWAVDQADPVGGRLLVEVRFGGERIGVGAAETLREDLRQYGTGRYGFEVRLSRPVEVRHFIDGSVQVVARRGDGTGKTLGMGPHAKAFVTLAEAGRLVSELSLLQEVPLKHALWRMTTSGSAIEQKALVPVLATLRARWNVGAPRPEQPAGAASPLFFPVGFEAGDGSARLGRDGHVFLLGGSNDVARQMALRPEDPVVRSKAERWCAIIRERARRLAPRRFLQVVVPEKLTVLPELSDLDVTPPTALLAAIEHGLADGPPGEGADFLSCRHVLRAAAPRDVFRRVDSHLTPLGGYLLAAEIVRRLGHEPPPPPCFGDLAWRTGDLSSRMTGSPVYEAIAFQGGEVSCYAARRPTGRHVPPDGGHIGRRASWSNPEAPIAETVLAFGNSFMDSTALALGNAAMDGAADQSSISYWLASWFAEYHFVFSPAVDPAELDAVRPAAVICQTIERFLIMLPADRWEAAEALRPA